MELRRLKFIEEYIKTGCQTEAARQAGYKSPTITGHRLLRNANVKAMVEARTRELQAQSTVTRELIEQNLLDKARNAKRDSDQLRAWEILAKMGGYLKEQTQQVVGLFTRIEEPKSVVITNDTPST